MVIDSFQASTRLNQSPPRGQIDEAARHGDVGDIRAGEGLRCAGL